MQNENNIKKKRLMQQKNYLLQQQKNETATIKGQMRDATSKNRVTKQTKLLVAIAKQHYCKNKNKKNARCNIKKTSATKKLLVETEKQA